MADERPFLTLQHPFNRRWAIVEDDGVGAWLYVTEPDQPAPVADCFIYSCVEPVDTIPANWDRSSPPPLTKHFATERAWQPDAASAAIRVAWTSNGNAAVVLMKREYLERRIMRVAASGSGATGLGVEFRPDAVILTTPRPRSETPGPAGSVA